MAEFLRPYGAYTVCSGDWYLERPTGRNMDAFTCWPTPHPSDDDKRDTWIFPIDGSQFECKSMYRERLVCYIDHDVMHFASVGDLDPIVNNELELLKKLTMAEQR